MTVSNSGADAAGVTEADNARLRRLLDEAGVHDGLRHALRDPVALLRQIIRRTTSGARDVVSYAAHLDGRLDTLVRIRERTDSFGEASLHGLVSDELLAHLVHEGEQAWLAGPRVQLRPKAAQVLGLAVHELASNAVEHGALGMRDGRVSVTWQVEMRTGAPALALIWTETAVTPQEPARRGFGMEVLEGMLAFELGALVDVSHEPDERRCVIRFPPRPPSGARRRGRCRGTCGRGRLGVGAGAARALQT